MYCRGNAGERREENGRGRAAEGTAGGAAPEEWDGAAEGKQLKEGTRRRAAGAECLGMSM